MSNLSDFTGAPEGILSKYEEFTTSGTWTKDPEATWVYVECIGGGGGYGGADGSDGGAGFSKVMRSVDLPSSITVTVGAGGVGADGGDTIFNSFVAKGGRSAGSGDSNFFNYSYGYGSGAAGGDTVMGGGGGSGLENYPGGKSVFGGNGGTRPNDGEFPGGGGGGYANGADGVVRIWQW